jgi:hypothetical protein
MPETDSCPALAGAKALQAELVAAFGAPAVSRFADLPVIGCAEHERDFAWYRAHYWGDMPDAIAAANSIPSKYRRYNRRSICEAIEERWGNDALFR